MTDPFVQHLLLAILIVGPVAMGLLALVSPGRKVRGTVIALAAVSTMAAGVLLAVSAAQSGHELSFSLGGIYPKLAAGLELAVILVILAIAVRVRSVLIILLGLAQLGLAIAGEVVAAGQHEPLAAPITFKADALALILVLVVSIIGSIIVLYSPGYMKKHMEHAPPTAAGEGRFFLFLIGFLGAMNGLVLANDLKWLSVFWEITTLCSFMLIGQDGTPEARANAKRALLLNSLGGLAMIFAGFLALTQARCETLAELMDHSGATGMTFAMALLCLAAFTKSAQMPFQSWLLGAMVAPTPVSALLHSATMVKAGSYLVLRLAPAMTPPLSVVIAIAGAFTFMVTSGLAVTQSNGKKVLAYSTIANLGLIVACAGINTPLAYAAGVLILVFHACSKALLFLCIGTIEQRIGSRDIEDMGGIMFLMPVTTVITLIGMVSMLIPPFGMLLSKWLAVEAAINMPAVLLMLIIGAALTVWFWAKWIGRIQTVSFHEKYQREQLPAGMLVPMLVLAIGVVAGGLAAFPIFGTWVKPMVEPIYHIAPNSNAMLNAAGAFITWPVYLFVGLGLLAAWIFTRRLKPKNIRQPFLCGENIGGITRTYTFRSAMDKSETAWSASYYLKDVLTESRITFWGNMLATAILLTMFGVLTT